MLNLSNINLGIIGLGYVGLPLAIEFAKKFNVVGFDIDENRVQELKNGYDRTKEINKDDFKNIDHLVLTSNINELKNCSCYIVTVPTPIKKENKPDLGPLFSASRTVASVLKKGDIVIYESTVYPGCTEEECVPILEYGSSLQFNKDFFCGYSPERINPGDKKHRLPDIIKITSGSTPKVSKFVDKLYSSIVTAGTHCAPSIKVAEAAKVIENTQRDLNIALVNELSILFDRLDINTFDVLNAASTKWNFLNFVPGLVGGHCIGVDPYYLTFKAKACGYIPEVVLAGRRVNDSMGEYIALKLNKILDKTPSKILLMGFTFKENCPDIRNTKVIDVYQKLVNLKHIVDIYDPIADKSEVYREYGLRLIEDLTEGYYEAIVITVAHKDFKNIGFQRIKNLCREKQIIFDIKNVFNLSKETFTL